MERTCCIHPYICALHLNTFHVDVYVFSLLPMQALSHAYYGMEFVVSLDAFDFSIDTPIWCEGFGVLMVIRLQWKHF